MATEAQIAANRLNAQKSTGPRTEEGKAVSSQNALTHGLLAREGAIRGEDEGEFFVHQTMLLGQLDPATPVEDILANRIVDLSWRLKRAARDQDQIFGRLYDQFLGDQPEPAEPAEREALLGRMLLEDYQGAAVLERLLKCERRIEGSLYRTLNEMRRVFDQRVKVAQHEKQDLAEAVVRWREEDGEARKRRMVAQGRPAEPPAWPEGAAASRAEGVSSLKCEVSSEQGHAASLLGEKVCDAHPTEFAFDTAGRPSCETNPISAGAKKDPAGYVPIFRRQR